MIWSYVIFVQAVQTATAVVIVIVVVDKHRCSGAISDAERFASGFYGTGMIKITNTGEVWVTRKWYLVELISVN